MTTYRWNPTYLDAAVEWHTPSNWLPVGVPASPDADVVVPETFHQGVPFTSGITIENNESYVIRSLAVAHQILFLKGTLSVLGELAMGPNISFQLTSADLTFGSLSNDKDGVPISGSGRISTTSNVDNHGAISGMGGGLTLSFAGLQNEGWLSGDAGNLEVDVGPGGFTNLPAGMISADEGEVDINVPQADGTEGGFANLAGGTLTVGTYEVQAGGILNLNVGADIVADAATINLSATGGSAPLLETEVNGIKHPLSQTLRTITPAGVLWLQRMDFDDSNPLTVAGEVRLAEATLGAPQLAIQAGATVGGFGAIAGPVTNDGLLFVGALESAIGGSLVVNGTIGGSGSIAILSGNSVPDRSMEHPTVLELSSADSNDIDFEAGGNGVLVLDSPMQISGRISGLTSGVDDVTGVGAIKTTDRIVLPGLSVDAITNLGYSGTPAGGTLSFRDAGASVALNFAGDHSLGDFVLQAAPKTLRLPSPGIEIHLSEKALCFLAGTMIATPGGETPVERLVVGDTVSLLGGGIRPITWIGTGRVRATRGQRNAATPVIVSKGALANNVPHRDLRVTKGHALFLGGALIPVEFLVNHRSIYWDDRAQDVSLYHIELDSHAVLLANGAPAESYRDDGNRWLFQNTNGGWGRPPPPPCVEVLTGGPIVDAVWRDLLDRAGPRPSLPLTNDPDLHLLVDGARVEAGTQVAGVSIFNLGDEPRAVRIASRAAAPQELGLSRDPRSLGVALRRIAIRQGNRFRVIEADDPRLSDGMHAFEADNAFRWTDGDAPLPNALFGGFTGPIELVVQYAATAHYIENGGSSGQPERGRITFAACERAHQARAVAP